MQQTANPETPKVPFGTSFLAAAVQMVSGPRVADNLAAAADLVAEAAGRGAKLIALPEYFPLMGLRETDKLAHAETDDGGPIQDFLAEAAGRHGVWLFGGSLPLAASTPGKVRNSMLVFDPEGRRAARYDKIHLFGFTQGEESYDEGRTIEPGAGVAVVDLPFARVGVAICYDLRFPEMFRAMGEVDLLVLPAAFTATTGRAHWEVLLRARAVENLCYVLASAQGGEHENGRRTHGHSMLVDPWGEVRACLPQGPGVVVAEVDPARLAAVRASLPALAHRVL